METEFRVILASRLREERDRLQLSQPDMAAAGGAKPRTYQDWERAVATVSTEFLSAAAASIGIDVLYVMTGVRMSGLSGPAEPEDWRLVPNPATAQAVLDRLTEMAGSRALEGDDWQLIDQLVSRLARR